MDISSSVSSKLKKLLWPWAWTNLTTCPVLIQFFDRLHLSYQKLVHFPTSYQRRTKQHLIMLLNVMTFKVIDHFIKYTNILSVARFLNVLPLWLMFQKNYMICQTGLNGHHPLSFHTILVWPRFSILYSNILVWGPQSLGPHGELQIKSYRVLYSLQKCCN